jgi:hypothetical protein
VDHLLASFLQLVSMSRTASSWVSDRASYGSSASKSECPRQQVLSEASVWRGLVVIDCQPKNSSKCKRGAGSTATAGSRRSIAGLASDARCAGSSRAWHTSSCTSLLNDLQVRHVPRTSRTKGYFGTLGQCTMEYATVETKTFRLKGCKVPFLEDSGETFPFCEESDFNDF